MKQPKPSIVTLSGICRFPQVGASAGRRLTARANPSGSRKCQAKKNRTPNGALFFLVTLPGLEPGFTP